MNEFGYEEYLKEQVQKIEELKTKGYTDRELLDVNRFCFEALKKCRVPISYLVPRAEPQQMTLQEWCSHSGYQWEYYDEIPFGSIDIRDSVLLGLLYSMGVSHLLDILPEETRKEIEREVLKMGLSLEDSETFCYLAKERSIKIAKNMFKAGVDKEEILYYTELTEEEFIKEVVKKVNE